MCKKSKEKNDKRWSAELTETTRRLLEARETVVMKHIGSKPGCIIVYVPNDFSDSSEPFIHLPIHLPESYNEYLTKCCKDYSGEHYLLFDIGGSGFHAFYNTIDEIIDDGWAVD